MEKPLSAQTAKIRFFFHQPRRNVMRSKDIFPKSVGKKAIKNKIGWKGKTSFFSFFLFFGRKLIILRL